MYKALRLKITTYFILLQISEDMRWVRIDHDQNYCLTD